METRNKKAYQILSGNALKMIAVITMLIDHTAVVMIENGILNGPYNWDFDRIYADPQLSRWLTVDMTMRMIGRIAFPIFCYLLIEGYFHTRNVVKYGQRLLLFALISEIPFDLAVWGAPFDIHGQNVYFTLFLGLMAMVMLDKYGEGLLKRILIMAVLGGAAELIRCDYGAFGVIFIMLLYLFREKPVQQIIWGSVALFWELTAPLAFIPIRMYNGERGKLNLKYLFYAFYPAHLLILWLTAYMMKI